MGLARPPQVTTTDAPAGADAGAVLSIVDDDGVTVKGLLVARRVNVLAEYRWNSYLPGGWL